MSYSEEKTEVKEKRTYSVAELREFDVELKEFRVTKKIYYPVEREITVLDMERLYESVGVMKRGAVIVKDVERDKDKFIIKADVPYKEFQNKLNQYNTWKGKKEFAQRKEVEGMEELAEKMNIN